MKNYGLRNKVVLIFLGFVWISVQSVFANRLPNGELSICWPTEISPLEVKNCKTIDECIQPTVSGIINSGKFGLVREQGTKFHEGIDIRSFKKDKKGKPVDEVYAFLSGKVVHVNDNPSASSYGRYIVVQHDYFCTLYAHLSSVAVHIGDLVNSGQLLGVMGTTSSCITIPDSRAHLHFEINFPLGDQAHFAQWYDSQYKDKNHHGMYNGLNLVGIDPLFAIENAQKGKGWILLFTQEKEVATVEVLSTKIPSFIQNYGLLFASGYNLKLPVKGWKIKFTWYGLPFAWQPLYTLSDEKMKATDIKLPKTNTVVRFVSYRKSLLKSAVLRDVLSENKLKNEVKIGTRIINNLSKIGF